MASPGEQLRSAREERGLTLEDIQAATHIRAEYLAALEQDDLVALPDETVARGFLRNYARFLELDPKPLLAEYGQMEIELPEPIQNGGAMDVPLQVSPIPTGTILSTTVFILVVAALVAGTWFVYPRRAELLDRFNRGAPVGLIDETVTATIESAPSTTPISSQQENGTERPTRTPLPTATTTATPVPTATQPPRTPTPGDDGVPVDEIPADEIRVVLEIDAPAWTRVTVDGEEAYIGTLEGGDEREWVGREVITIRTGNAGGVRLRINGEDYGILGDPGEVLDRILRRNVENGQIEVLEPTPTPVPTTAG